MLIESTSKEASPCLNISVEVFVPKDKIDLINKWLSARGLETCTEDDLPATGFMCLNNGVPLIYFLMYKAETSKCWFEDVVANPFVPRKDIKNTIDNNFASVVLYAEDIARDMGYKAVSVLTKLPLHAKRFKEIGYSQTDRVILLGKGI